MSIASQCFLLANATSDTRRSIFEELPKFTLSTEKLMSILIIEDLGVERLVPLVLARLSSAVTCGALKLVDLLAWIGADCYGLSRTHLQAIQQLDYPILKDPRQAPGADRPKLVLSSRLVPNAANLSAIEQWLNHCDPGVTQWIYEGHEPGSEVIGVLYPTETFQKILSIGRNYLMHSASRNPVNSGDSGKQSDRSQTRYVLDTFRFPHDVIRHHMACLRGNLELLISKRQYQQIQDGVFVGPDVTLASHVVLEPKAGPIVLESNVQVGPFSLLRGPLYLGAKCKVLEHASLKDGVCAGHTTKIGGEVEASIVEPYSNKQHHGFLGHSYVGSWVNLGAGTCTSDLKNTYGMISMDYPSGRIATEMQFLGCFIGDYSKTAINTSIFTG